jgi:hypothetical protein
MISIKKMGKLFTMSSLSVESAGEIAAQITACADDGFPI